MENLYKGIRNVGRMLNVPCPLCGSNRRTPIHKEGDFIMNRCISCGFIYMSPRPDKSFIIKFYQHYLPKNSDEIYKWKKMTEKVFEKAANFIESNTKRKGKILDVGCGFGFFVKEMKERGWEAEGVDLSAYAINFGRKYNLSLFKSTIWDMHYPDDYFDVITAFYLIEHLEDPLGFIKEVLRILKPGGIFLARYPHTTPIKNMLAFFKIKNHLYNMPAHLSDFSPKKIKEVLEGVGFKNVYSFPGGYTKPEGFFPSFITAFLGILGEGIYLISRGKILIPGISKNVIGWK